jgi:phage gp29-like protein
MRTIKTAAGTPLELDGDVLAVIEAVSRDLLRRQTLEYGFEDVDREFAHLVAQMSEEELRAYLKESLFMSFNRYENEQMSGLIRRAKRAEEEGRAD